MVRHIVNHQKDCFYLTHDITKITDYSFLKPDIIFHMAAIARIQPSFKDPLNYFEKRKKCKEGADRADTVHMGKIYYKNCMDN